MIYGTSTVASVVEESVCRTSKDYKFTDIGIYNVHSNALMPDIPFEEASDQPYSIDKTIFLNDDDTKMEITNTIICQNYITARYIGRAPLEWYDSKTSTKMGREFVMMCRGGKTGDDYRIFGTEDAIRGYNKNANDNSELPGGGET
jgi:hypothetical protein